MAGFKPQTYENHPSLDWVYLSQAVVFLLALLLAAVSFIPGPAGDALLRAAVILLAAGNLVIMYKVRHYPLTLQDRIIRLEMQVRLRRLLPAERHWEIKGLSVPQLIGLRFAPDEELPDLMKKVLEERITRPDDIKKLVKRWEPDYHRI